MKKSAVLAVLVALVALAIPMSSFASTPEADAMVYVGHGIPGQDLGLDPALPVDVLVNDSICLLQGFTFGQFAGPVALAAATYNIKIKLADPVNPCTGATAIEANVPFAAGENSTVIAHLTADGQPTAAKYVNDLSALAPQTVRLVVRHAAAAPSVDLRAARLNPPKAVVRVFDLANPDPVQADVPSGKYAATIRAHANKQIVAGPLGLMLPEGKVTIYYAVGSVSTGSFTLLSQWLNPMP
jgi:hypothetical protein